MRTSLVKSCASSPYSTDDAPVAIRTYVLHPPTSLAGRRSRVCGSRRAVLLLPSSVRDLANQGERALGGVGEVPLFSCEVCFAMLRSLAETLPNSLLGLLGHNLGLKVLAQVFHIRRHAAPDLEHLPLYTLWCLTHRLTLSYYLKVLSGGLLCP